MNRIIVSFIISFFIFFSPCFSYDGDMDIYHEFKEELSLIRDGYASCINMALENSDNLNEKTALLAQKGAKTWKEIEYESPNEDDLPHLKIKEIPYGFNIKGTHGAYKVEANVQVKIKEKEVYYEVKHTKFSNAPGKEIFEEVFRNY